MSFEPADAGVDDTWEDGLDKDEISEKMGKIRMSADAEEFIPRNSYYGLKGL